jgi:predicted nucleic acid-binding protein
MSLLCIDTSFVIRLITQTPTHSTYLELWEQWMNTETEVIAPSLLPYEVCNGLHRQAIANLITFAESEQLLQVALALPITLYQDDGLHLRSRSLAQEFSLPATYDAHYLALAERFDAEFWTCDRRLFNAVQARLSWVHLVSE